MTPVDLCGACGNPHSECLGLRGSHARIDFSVFWAPSGYELTLYCSDPYLPWLEGYISCATNALGTTTEDPVRFQTPFTGWLQSSRPVVPNVTSTTTHSTVFVCMITTGPVCNRFAARSKTMIRREHIVYVRLVIHAFKKCTRLLRKIPLRLQRWDWILRVTNDLLFIAPERERSTFTFQVCWQISMKRPMGLARSF